MRESFQQNSQMELATHHEILNFDYREMTCAIACSGPRERRGNHKPCICTRGQQKETTVRNISKISAY
jgi:hypothetical protein